MTVLLGSPPPAPLPRASQPWTAVQRATRLTATPPAAVKSPPATSQPPATVRLRTIPSVPVPTADQPEASQRATCAAAAAPAVVNAPPA